MAIPLKILASVLLLSLPFLLWFLFEHFLLSTYAFLGFFCVIIRMTNCPRPSWCSTDRANTCAEKLGRKGFSLTTEPPINIEKVGSVEEVKKYCFARKNINMTEEMCDSISQSFVLRGFVYMIVAGAQLFILSNTNPEDLATANENNALFIVAMFLFLQLVYDFGRLDRQRQANRTC